MGCLSTLSRFDLHKYEKILSTYVLLSQPASLLNLLIASDFVTETQYVGQCNTLSCTLYSLSGVDEFNGDVMFAGQYHTYMLWKVMELLQCNCYCFQSTMGSTHCLQRTLNIGVATNSYHYDLHSLSGADEVSGGSGNLMVADHYNMCC
jgi:hypothetical protein